MNKNTLKLGWIASFVALIATIGYSTVQILQIAGIIHPPMDAILIYSFSMVIATPFLISLLALQLTLKEDRKIWGNVAIVLALMYTVFVTIVYAVQLATVLPASSSDQRNVIPSLVMYPHSLFWTLDGLGYIFMGLSALFCAFAFSHTPEDRWTKRFFLAHGLITPLICIAYFYPHFSIALLFFGSPWVITAIGSMVSLTLYFNRKSKKENKPIEVKESKVQVSKPVSI